MFDKLDKDHHYIDFFRDKIAEFGGGLKDDEKKLKYVFRNNTKDEKGKGTYFGCINEGEAPTGVYSDLSIVVLVTQEDDSKNDRWIIGLGVGTQGYKNDHSIASLPGTRRSFRKYLSNTLPESFIKTDFLDIESKDGFTTFKNGLATVNKPATLNAAIGDYPNLFLTATLLNPNDSEDTKEKISLYLALYAKLRDWPNKKQKKDIDKILDKYETTKKNDNEIQEEVRNLIENRKYVVLQGAPGTGKTRLAKNIAEKNDLVFFTQFHAETTYSEFIYGITPDVQSSQLNYIDHEGIFVKAIKAALDENNKDKKVYLIIDEINRANLSNVLGPSFYLFEPRMSKSNYKIEICPGLELTKLPENFYVIATMNTADRSLAVVDFALRRRFAWYTLTPHIISHEIVLDDGKKEYFCEKAFKAIADIFEKYATDEELSLQPGHAYFIVDEDNENNEENKEMNDRLRYEIMPLIKEYLLDGMLTRAKDDFISYFRKTIGEEMFK